MEHSLLHGLQLCGLVVALGGAFFVLALLVPASRDVSLCLDEKQTWERVAATWVARGALVAALAAVADFFVQVAEIEGNAIYGGVDLKEVFRFATQTTVGRIGVWRAFILALVACFGGSRLLGKWWCVAAFGSAAALLSGLVSHSAAVPTGRTAAIVAQVMHIVMGSLWIGVLVHFLACRRLFASTESAQTGKLVTRILARFSPFALSAVLLIGCSGIYSLYRFVRDPEAIVTSPYGLMLMLKLLLIALVAATGCINWRVIRPELERTFSGEKKWPEEDRGKELLSKLSRMLELEVTAGILVITVAGILGSISPPGPNGVYRLSEVEMKALLTPDLPTTAITNPASFVGAENRTRDDLEYAEFTHNWSGVLVMLLGFCWLGQSIRKNEWLARAWPLLLIPFAVFIAVAADPEVWILRRMSLRQVLSDPQILEHQIGALLVMAMVWLGWRETKRPASSRPLGYALPIIITAGSLMLLGHAHTSLTISDHLGTLINVQHIVIGAFGLVSGFTRWLQLRGLLPEKAARILWPSSVVGLGIVMAFFYREII